MTKWEYKALLADGPKTEEHLSKLGGEGWELVSVISFAAAGPLGNPKGVFGFYFKRPKPEVLS